MFDAARGEARWHVATLVAILVLAGALRLAYIDRPSLFYDEVIVMQLATAPGPRALLERLPDLDATRAPLHPLLLQPWLALFGPTPLAGRAFSAVCGVLTVLLVERIGRRVFDPRVGLWAAFLCAISPMQVRYAQEVRMYALLVLETCLAWDLLFSFRVSARLWKQLAYLGCLVALGYTHPLGLFMVIALALGYLADRASSRLSLRHWMVTQVAAGLAVAPWVIQYMNHPPDIVVGRLPLKFLIGLPIGFIGGNSLALAGFVALVVYGMFKGAEEEGHRFTVDQPTASLAVLIWFAVPALLLYGHSRISSAPIFGPPRYTLFVGPAYLILVARGLAKLPVVLRYTVAAAAVLLAAALLKTLVYAPDVKADWRSAAARVHAVDPRAPVVLLTDAPTNYGQFVPLRYYFGPDVKIMMMTEALERLAVDPQALGGHAWTIVEFRDGKPKAYPPEVWLRWYAPTSLAWTLPAAELSYYRLRRPAGR
jgi:4-amino-4-deoxy-L-arabinose transferase-like glycosyltransferase